MSSARTTLHQLLRPRPRPRPRRVALVVPFTAAVAGLALALPGDAGAAPGAAAASQSVMIMDYRYQPGSLTVTVGDSVTWTNHDQAPHDVYGTSGPAALQSPELAQGQSWTYTTQQPGAYAYICSIHPEMTATMTVQAAPTTTAPPTAAPAPTPAQTAPPAQSSPDAAPATPQGDGAPVTAPPAATPGSGTAIPGAGAAATTTSSPAGAAAADDGAADTELSAAPTGSSEPTTDLPPLLVAAIVVAVVLGCVLALFGNATPRMATRSAATANGPTRPAKPASTAPPTSDAVGADSELGTQGAEAHAHEPANRG